MRPPAAAGHRPMAGTRLGSAWRARGVKRPYSHRQGRVIFELRLTNQPGSRACPAGVPAVRGDSSRPDRPRPALNWRPPGEPVRVAPRCSQADAARAALPPCAGRAGQPSTLLHAPASPAHTGITGTARSSWASMPASGCRASCETGLAAAYLRAVIWDRGDRPELEAVMADQSRTPPTGFAARRPTVVSCWLCGIGLQQHQMVPDGGSACGDIRWYCRDARACTERWTSPRRQARAAGADPGRGAVTAPLPSATAHA